MVGFGLIQIPPDRTGSGVNPQLRSGYGALNTAASYPNWVPGPPVSRCRGPNQHRRWVDGPEEIRCGCCSALEPPN